MLAKKIAEQEKVFLLDEAAGFKYSVGQDKDLVHLHEETLSYPKVLPKTPRTPKTPKTPKTPAEQIKIVTTTITPSPKSSKPMVPQLELAGGRDKEGPGMFSTSSSGRGYSVDSTDSQFSSFFSTHRKRTFLPKIEEENPNEFNVNNVKLYERSPDP